MRIITLDAKDKQAGLRLVLRTGPGFANNENIAAMPVRVGHEETKGIPRPTLVAWREHRFPGKSQAFVAKRVPCAGGTLSRYESGQTGLSDAAAKRLAKLYGAPSTYALLNQYPEETDLISAIAGATAEQKQLIMDIAKRIIKPGG